MKPRKTGVLLVSCSMADAVFRSEKFLADTVAGGLQAESVVGAVSAVIAIFHVKTQSANVRIQAGPAFNMSEQGPKDTSAAPALGDVYALYPPDNSVAPVAPLIGDHGAPDRRGGFLIGYSDDIEPEFGTIHQSADTTVQDGRGQFVVFCFRGQRLIEPDEKGNVG